MNNKFKITSIKWAINCRCALMNLFFIGSILLGSVGSLLAQNKYVLPQITPKSPDVAAFDQYGEVPVSLSTGMANVTIPLYSIKVDQLEIPLTLTYHNNGLKTDEIPSSVGFGWNLQAGGCISFQQKGNYDFDPQYGLNRSMLNKFFSGTMTSSERFSYLLNVVNSEITDSQYDIYNLNFLGYSCTFYFDDQMIVRTTPKIDLLIKKTDNGFEVTDLNGNKFYFDIPEYATMYDAGSVELRPSFSNISAYYLSKIITKNNRQLTFSYQKFNLQYNKPYKSVDQYPYTNSSCNLYAMVNSGETYTFQEFLVPQKITFDEGNITFTTSVLPRTDIQYINPNSNIPSLTGFEIYSTKSELLKKYSFSQGYFGNGTRLKLNAIQELSLSSEPGKRWSFSYYEGFNSFPYLFSFAKDHWGYYNGKQNFNLIPEAKYDRLIINYKEVLLNQYADRTSDFESAKLGLLQSIQYPTGGYSNFEYEPNQISTTGYNNITGLSPFLQIPKGNVKLENFVGDNTNVNSVNGYNTKTVSGSFVISDSGYYNIRIFQGAEPTHFFDSQINFTGDAESVLHISQVLNMYSDANGNRWGQKDVFLNAGTYTYSLTSGVGYNETTYTYFPVNANFDIGKYVPIVPEGGIKYIIGGVRVAKITSGDLSSVNASRIKKYVYKDELANVIFRNIPNYISTSEVGVQGSSGSGYPAMYCVSCGVKYTVSGESVVPFVGSDIEYLQVSEYEGENGEGGKKEMTFMPSSNEGGSGGLPYTPPLNTSWRSGNILTEKKYKYDNGQFTLIQDVTNGYYVGPKENITNGFKAEFSNYCNVLSESTVSFRTGLATLFSEKFYKNNIVENNYSNAVLTNTTNVDATSLYHTLPTIQQSMNSKNEYIKTKTVYSFDYNTTNVISDEAKGVKSLVDRNIIIPLEEVQIKNIAGIDYVIEAKLTLFKKDICVPDRVFGLKTGSKILLSDFIFSYINTTGNFVKDNRYEERIVFSQYDGFNNIVEAGKADDVKEVYLWGYNSTYPVAKLLGTDYATAMSKITDQSILNSPSSDVALRAELNKLRAIPGAMVTTYTYKPLVGMTSATDPSGKTVFYEYDGFQRLKLIRDQEGKIVKQFDYTYQGQ